MTGDEDDDGADSPRSARSTGGRSTDEQPTVTVGSDGYRSVDAADPKTTAGLENAIPTPDGEFDWRGWLLVTVVLLAFIVVPVIILLRPLRLVGFRTTYLVLPLLPALVLGATAVWVAVRSRQGDR